MAASGPGCGGTRPCEAERPATSGSARRQKRPSGRGERDNDRQEQHEADAEEHRQAEHECRVPGPPTAVHERRSRDDGRRDDLRRAGFGKQFPEDRCQAR